MSDKVKVLIGTPLYNGPTTAYTLGLAELLSQPDPDVEWIPSFVRSTYVSAARSKLVHEARKHGCAEICFVDADVGFLPDHLRRLRSHDVDIVSGFYPKKQSGDPDWIAHAVGQPPEGTLLEVNDCAGGLLRVKMHVFDRIDEVFPHRSYQHPGEEPKTEFFPHGLVEKGGHRHPAEVKIDGIRAVLASFEMALGAEALSAEISSLIERNAPENGPGVELVGEDVGFCRLAKAAGFKIWADLSVRARHYGEIGFPAAETPI